MTNLNLQRQPIDITNKQLLSPTATSELLGVKPQTLAIWRMKGVHINYIKVGRRVLYSIDDIKDFLSRNRKAVVA